MFVPFVYCLSSLSIPIICSFVELSSLSKTIGLCLGISSVLIGQISTITYYVQYSHKQTVQQKEPRIYPLWETILKHFAELEGIVLLAAYLSTTWYIGWMPLSYYYFSGGISWIDVLSQLLVQDFLQYIMHRFEHHCSTIYKYIHKPHHRFTNPILFDAFQGSCGDTIFMILIPLFITSRIVHTNGLSYMTFGTIYANWLTLIHSEYIHSWDTIFSQIGFGTPMNHHIHHKLYKYNYGHLFTYWDHLFGTYKKNLIE
jgi:sterol desaturase/sphingolipid hydroxylase (fatty acid hydroxylase superfamily)